MKHYCISVQSRTTHTYREVCSAYMYKCVALRRSNIVDINIYLSTFQNYKYQA